MRARASRYRARLVSPVGEIELLATDLGLTGVVFPSVAVERPEASAGGCLGDAAAQLREYFAGERTSFDLPLDPVGTPFQRAVWDVLRTIPFGETISYGEQARRLGDRRKARAVGAANGRNPLPIIVPCHRVIGVDGSLVGFSSGLDAKRWLLAHEGRHSVVTFPTPAVSGAIGSFPRASAGI